MSETLLKEYLMGKHGGFSKDNLLVVQEKQIRNGNATLCNFCCSSDGSGCWVEYPEANMWKASAFNYDNRVYAKDYVLKFKDNADKIFDLAYFIQQEDDDEITISQMIELQEIIDGLNDKKGLFRRKDDAIREDGN